jgi:hypothetical protein
MNKPAQSFRDLIVWQKAHEFVLRTYELTKQFPREEQYCLIPQLRRAAISIPKLPKVSRSEEYPIRITSLMSPKDRWKNAGITSS